MDGAPERPRPATPPQAGTAGGEPDAPPDAGRPSPAPGIGSWRHRSSAGAIAAAALLGLGDALEGRQARERPAIVSDEPSQPLDPEALVDVDLEDGSPMTTWVRLRTPRPPA
jgi:hypothetical protein